MLSPKKWLPVVVIALGVAAILYSVIRPPRNRPVVLPDGCVLRLEGVTYGTNAFQRGTAVERLLGRWIPPKWINRIGFKLRVFYPEPGEAAITAWLSVKGRSNATFLPRGGQVSSSRLEGFRVFATSQSGRWLENPPGTVMLQSSNDVLIAVPIVAFPRAEKEIILRLFRQGNAGTPLASFRLGNPRQSAAAHWTAQSIPATQRLEDLDVTLEKVSVFKETLMSHSVSVYSEVKFRWTTPGQTNAGWRMPECVIRDDEGNSYRWARRYDSVKGSARFDMKGALESDRIWKVEAVLVRSAGFPAEELLNFQIGSGQRQSLTNAAGRVFWCAFDGRNLEFSDPAGSEMRPHSLDVLAATDQDGSPVRFGGPTWKGSRERVQSHSWWIRESSATLLDVNLAFPKAVEIEFFVRPEEMK